MANRFRALCGSRFVAVLLLCAGASRADDLYTGWQKMYDLQFPEAQRQFTLWQRTHPTNPLGPLSHAAAYLFSEFARLGVLESELFIEDKSFFHRQRLQADPAAKEHFLKELDSTDQMADAALATNANDTDALLAKSLALGLRADYLALIERQNVAPLKLTKESRAYAERLLKVDPNIADAHIAPGVENYLLSQKPLPVRWVLGWTGAQTDRQTGVEELKHTASQGHYLEPFAKLLLAVAALRDKDTGSARSILEELHRRFPDNPLYLKELSRLKN